MYTLLAITLFPRQNQKDQGEGEATSRLFPGELDVPTVRSTQRMSANIIPMDPHTFSGSVCGLYWRLHKYSLLPHRTDLVRWQ